MERTQHQLVALTAPDGELASLVTLTPNLLDALDATGAVPTRSSTRSPTSRATI